MNDYLFDDSDMKIADAPDYCADTFDTLSFLEESRKQHFNGNIQKSRQLGSVIVSAFSYKAAPDEQVQLAEECGVTLDDQCLSQMKQLTVFAAEHCIETCIPASLSSVAISSMYDVLEEVSPDLYKTLSASMAFSYYHLCLNEGGNLAENIGRRFAVLCGKKNDAALAAFGRQLFEINTGVFRRAIREYAFII